MIPFLLLFGFFLVRFFCFGWLVGVDFLVSSLMKSKDFFFFGRQMYLSSTGFRFQTRLSCEFFLKGRWGFGFGYLGMGNGREVGMDSSGERGRRRRTRGYFFFLPHWVEVEGRR